MKKTRTELANMALGFLGLVDNFITDIDSDTSDTNTAVNELYEVAREETLCAHNWPVAKKTVALVAATSAPPEEWSAAYNLPTDFLYIRDLPNGDKDRASNALPLWELASDIGLKTAVAITTWGIYGQFGIEHWIVTASAHGCQTGDRVLLSGVSGEAAMNDFFRVAVLNSTTLMLLHDATGLVYAWGPLVSPTGGSLQRVGAAQVLYTDVADAIMEYTYRVDESDDDYLPDYDHTYVMAFTYRLAFYLALRLVRDNTKLRKEMDSASESYLTMARSRFANQQRFRNAPPTSSYLQARK